MEVSAGSLSLCATRISRIKREGAGEWGGGRRRAINHTAPDQVPRWTAPRDEAVFDSSAPFPCSRPHLPFFFFFFFPRIRESPVAKRAETILAKGYLPKCLHAWRYQFRRFVLSFPHFEIHWNTSQIRTVKFRLLVCLAR